MLGAVMRRACPTVVTFGLMLALTACSAPQRSDTSAVDGPERARASTPAGEDFRAANDEMHMSMSAPLSGNTDVDFVRSMIPHHKAALTMARIELKFGKDPELRAMATEIIRTQQAEIDKMQSWLGKQPPSARR